MTGGCVFCGGGELTRQHIFGQKWLHDLFPSDGYTHTRESEITGTKSWGSRTVDVTARVVCKTCNSGWLNDIERSAQQVIAPMVTGTAVSLSAEEQTRIALWAAVVAVTMRYASPGHRPVPDEWLQSLRATRAPPPATFIWLAAYVGSHDLKSFVHELDLELPSAGPSTTDGILFTAAIRHFVFQVGVFGWVVDDIQVVVPDEVTHLVVPIWPVVDQVVHWPPPRLNDEGLLGFSRSFLNADS